MQKKKVVPQKVRCETCHAERSEASRRAIRMPGRFASLSVTDYPQWNTYKFPRPLWLTALLLSNLGALSIANGIGCGAAQILAGTGEIARGPTIT